jgi:hypothetical protein
MPLTTFLLLASFLSAASWVLVSHLTIRQCRHAVCQPFAGRPQPHVHVVQTFPTPEACLVVREQFLQRVDEAEATINRMVQARDPASYLWTSTTFVCQPDDGTVGTPATTGEQWR